MYTCMTNAMMKRQADAINEVARMLASHGNKAYICDVKRAMGYHTDAFNHGLLMLAREGFVKLTRADQAMNTDKLDASQTTQDLGTGIVAEFHLIEG